MLTVDDVAYKHASEMWKCGSVLLFRAEGLINVVIECKKEGVEIGGVEGFRRCSDDRIQPRQEYNFDVEDRADPYGDLIYLLEQLADTPEIWFELY